MLKDVNWIFFAKSLSFEFEIGLLLMFCNAALASNFNYISMPTKAVGDILSETIIYLSLSLSSCLLSLSDFVSFSTCFCLPQKLFYLPVLITVCFQVRVLQHWRLSINSDPFTSTNSFNLLIFRTLTIKDFIQIHISSKV